MQFLNAVSRLPRNDDRNIAKRFYFSAVLAKQPDNLHSFFLCRFGRKNNILAVAGSGNAEKYIARLSEGFHHPFEDMLETIIIRDTAHMRRISKCKRRKRAAILAVPACPFFGKVHGIAMA